MEGSGKGLVLGCLKSRVSHFSLEMGAFFIPSQFAIAASMTC